MNPKKLETAIVRYANGGENKFCNKVKKLISTCSITI